MNPVLSYHYPLCCANASQFPYVGKIPVGENVNFVYQFVKRNDSFTVYITETHENIIGTPIKFPNYEDFAQAYSIVCIFPNIIYYYPIESSIEI